MQKRLNILLATLTLLFVVQVQQAQAQKIRKKHLIKVWKISLESITQSLPPEQKEKYDQMNDTDKKAFAAYMEQMIGKMRIEFKSGGKATVNLFGEKNKEATWKLKKNVLTMNTEGKNRKMTILELSNEKFKFEAIDDDGKRMELTMVPASK
ncbi:lipocalin family protein [uncultured Microscilla sp.]|uniref:lipocalin family protein n=1 Tax=uncultured Microscilla sp. TaxID=432653 RepID=UPI002625DDB6|nr:lipocalin family protein [uncultured Microscilla sp.]